MSATLARRLADLGASPEVIAIAIEAVTLASRSVTTPSRSREAERAARYRKNRKQNQGVEKANDVSSTAPIERDGVTTRHDDAPTFLPSFSLNLEGTSEEGSKAESKKARSENARARGTRMLAGAPLTEPFRQAAIDLGAAPDLIPEMWVEHVDYWVAVPGQRGVKTEPNGWLATWRNDVRRKMKMGTYNGRNTNGARSSVGNAFDNLIARSEGFGGAGSAEDDDHRANAIVEGR